MLSPAGAVVSVPVDLTHFVSLTLLFGAISFVVDFRSIPVFIDCLKAEEATLRAAAAGSLGEIGPAVKEIGRGVVIPALLELARDRDLNAHRAAIDALRRIDPSVPRPRRR